MSQSRYSKWLRPWFIFMLEVFGLGCVIAAVTEWNTPDAFDFGLLGISCIGLGLLIAAWEVREFIKRTRRQIGVALVLLGIAILTIWLPVALRYVFQESADYDGLMLLGPLGGTLVAGGWFLRRVGTA